MDAFGFRGTTGKLLNCDISEGKCSWCAVKALELGSPAKKKLMHQYYGLGSSNPEAVEIIKNIYNELGLVDIFQAFKKECYDNSNRLVEQLPPNVPRDIFRKVIDNMFFSSRSSSIHIKDLSKLVKTTE